MRTLTWTHKWGHNAYAADTDEQLEGAARYILGKLIEDQWIPEPDEPIASDEDAELLGMSQEEVNKLPASLRSEAERTRKYQAARQKEYEEEREQYDQALRILSGSALWVCVREKAKYEDEWDAIVAASARWFGPVDVREDGLYRPETAWDILQSRDGYEYEDYRLGSIESHTIKAW